MTEVAPQREYSLREVFNGLHWMVRSGATWRMMPNDLPPWNVIYQQMQRWIKAQVFESLASDLRTVWCSPMSRQKSPNLRCKAASKLSRYDKAFAESNWL
jgi:transposase